jgi:hypothetical protein
MQQQEGDDGYPALQVFVFTSSGGDSDYPSTLLQEMMERHDEGHFRFAALCDPVDYEGDDGFDAFVVLDFNVTDRNFVKELAGNYFGSDVAFGTKRGTYGLKHI